MSVSKKKDESFATQFGAFCRFITDTQKEYAWCCEELKRLEGLQEDYLHMIEFGGLNYEGRAKVATQLKKVRNQRRECKNKIESMAPFVITMDKWGQVIPALQEALGRSRKVEKEQRNPVYVPRVLKDQGVISKV